MVDTGKNNDEKDYNEYKYKEHHLYYEIWMLFELEKELDKNKEKGVIKNALLESFALHARNIINFLSNKEHKRYNNKCYDMKYKDFFKHAKNKGPFINYNDVEDINNKINIEIVHLSKCRVMNKKTEWSTHEITSKLGAGIKKFMKEIEDAKVNFNSDYKKEINNVLKNNHLL